MNKHNSVLFFYYSFLSTKKKNPHVSRGLLKICGFIRSFVQAELIKPQFENPSYLLADVLNWYPSILVADAVGNLGV